MQPDLFPGCQIRGQDASDAAFAHVSGEAAMTLPGAGHDGKRYLQTKAGDLAPFGLALEPPELPPHASKIAPKMVQSSMRPKVRDAPRAR